MAAEGGRESPAREARQDLLFNQHGDRERLRMGAGLFTGAVGFLLLAFARCDAETVGRSGATLDRVLAARAQHPEAPLSPLILVMPLVHAVAPTLTAVAVIYFAASLFTVGVIEAPAVGQSRMQATLSALAGFFNRLLLTTGARSRPELRAHQPAGDARGDEE
jgi:hypothetical protein